MLDGLDHSLRKKAVHESVRSPESLFGELEDLNLVNQLRERLEVKVDVCR